MKYFEYNWLDVSICVVEYHNFSEMIHNQYSDFDCNLHIFHFHLTWLKTDGRQFFKCLDIHGGYLKSKWVFKYQMTYLTSFYRVKCTLSLKQNVTRLWFMYVGQLLIWHSQRQWALAGAYWFYASVCLFKTGELCLGPLIQVFQRIISK